MTFFLHIFFVFFFLLLFNAVDQNDGGDNGGYDEGDNGGYDASDDGGDDGDDGDGDGSEVVNTDCSAFAGHVYIRCEAGETVASLSLKFNVTEGDLLAINA